MRPYTKMMMMQNARRERGGEYRGTMEYRGEAEFTGGYGGGPENRFRDGRGRERYNDGRFAPRGEHSTRMGDDEEPEARFRDRTGREHYNNGRYAPRSSYSEPENRMPPIYDGYNTGYRYDGGNRMIGFYGGDEMQSNYRMDATHKSGNEMDRHGGRKMAGGASSSVIPLDREEAREWVNGMRHADGGSGEHWTMEQTNRVMKEKHVDCDPVEFYAIMNAMYSDYGKVADKFGVSGIDFWVEMAKAFLHDADAVPHKAARYYDCIVRK